MGNIDIITVPVVRIPLLRSVFLCGSMCEIAKGNFTAPAMMVDGLDVVCGEGRIRKVCNQILIGVWPGFHFYYPEL